MASYYPMIKNADQRIVFPILDADGDPVTGAAGDTPDSEYSLDGGGFADITDEIHEIATNSGIYYLDLASGETNGDVVTVQVKTATAGTKTTVLVFYTSAQSLDTVDTNVDTLVTRITAARAGYLDNINNANLATIPDISTIISGYLADATHGLAALETLVDDLETRLTATRAGYLDNLNNANLATIPDISTIISGYLADATHGLAALETLVDDLETRLTATRAGYLDNLNNANLATIPDISTIISGYLNHGTFGLSALETLVDDLESRLTAVRAGYLDNLSAGAVALEATVAALNNITAASVWAVGIRTLTDPTSYMANVSALALQATLLATQGAGFVTGTDSLVQLHDDHITLLPDSGLVINVAFTDYWLLLDSNGDPSAGATVTCTVYDESDGSSAGTVVPVGGGLYRCQFTPDAVGSWKTLWDCASPNATAAHLFKCGWA